MRQSVISDYAPAADARTHTAGYRERLVAALRSRRDDWGCEVLARPGGPSYEAVEPYLVPSLLCDPTYQTPVPYLPLSVDADADSFALHVVDGSHVIAEGIRNWLIQGAVLPNGDEAELAHKPARVPDEPARFFFGVGRNGEEPYGSRLDRLDEPRLGQGYLPILRLAYRDDEATLWERESFAAPASAGGPLTSWLRFTITADREAEAVLAVRVDAPGFGPVRLVDRTLAAAGGTLVRSSLPLELDTDTARIRVALKAGIPASVLVTVANAPDPAIGATALIRTEIDAAEAGVARRWNDLLDVPTGVEVPEERVMAAMRNLLIQNLTMGHRYSIGNPYERTFLMEGHLSIQPLLWFGFADRHRRELLDLAQLTNGAGPDWYESWERGTKLSAAAEHARLTGDATVLLDRLDAHREYLDSFAGMAEADPRGLLAPERYAWDIPEVIYGTHSQAVAWRGMVDILAAYRTVGHSVADEYAPAVARFGARLRAAIEAAMTRLPDGSLFVPIPLDGAEAPFEFLPATRAGNYWNLAFPYALTSGIFTVEELRALLSYMDRHGSFFLGLTRFSGLYEPILEQGEVTPTGTAGYKVAGIDNAFGIHHMRLLADLEEADRVALCLYSKLAHGMTRGTFLDGEATTLGVVPGEYHRSTWYPPNSTSNALFLLTLRTMLLHEHVDADGQPARLSLAPSTPPHWLEHGKRIAVRALPSSFGPVSYTLASALGGADPHLDVSVHLNSGRPDAPVALHLRVPAGWRAISVEGPDAAAVELDADRLQIGRQHHTVRTIVRYARTHG